MFFAVVVFFGLMYLYRNADTSGVDGVFNKYWGLFKKFVVVFTVFVVWAINPIGLFHHFYS